MFLRDKKSSYGSRHQPIQTYTLQSMHKPTYPNKHDMVLVHLKKKMFFCLFIFKQKI